MSSSMRYRVPLRNSGDGYTITNGKLGGPFEETDMEIGDVERPPIVITSYTGKSPEITCASMFDEIPKYVWKNAIKRKPTGNWLLTYITISPTSVNFNFCDKHYAKNSGTATILAEKGLEIWLEVPRDDGLPPAKYLIDSYRDGSVEEEYRIRVTEFYEHMKRQISVKYEKNPYFDQKIHLGKISSLNEYLLIAEYRD